MASRLIGYFDTLSVRAGHNIGLKLSSATATSCTLSLWRVAGAKWVPGTGSVPTLVPMPHSASGQQACEFRPIPSGSYGTAPAPLYLQSAKTLSFGMWVQPSSKRPKLASLLSFKGEGGQTTLGLDADGVPVVIRNGKVSMRAQTPLLRGEWALLACCIANDKITLSVQNAKGEVSSDDGAFSSLGGVEEVWFAARDDNGRATEHFDGRIEAPTLASVDARTLATALRQGINTLGPDCLASWDFGIGINTQTITDIGPERCDGVLINRPARAVTGTRWDGSIFEWRQAPDHYAAIHFHGDDLDDCKWPDDICLDIPEDWQAGLYAAKIENKDGSDLIPFVVRAKIDAAQPRLAVLLPTFTYLSYGNAHNYMRGPEFGVPSYADEETLAAHPALGRSQYDLHEDRTPVMFSSPQRPLMSMRFGVRPWGLPVDVALLGYLEHLGQSYEILTDADLDREGASALVNYDCVITGNHPEYYSTQMLDGLRAFTHRGGRLMYLGGNGFYWRVSVCADTGTIEVRRAEDGTRAWMAAPGEAFHAMDGGYGGLWRRLGHAPNTLVDVGFAAQGDFDISGHYVLRDDARVGAGAFILKGVDAERFGDYGWLGNGAAGQEIDRADTTLGTSQNTVIIASSTGHTPAMMRTIEEMLSTVPPFDDPKARADVTFRALEGDGAVFSVGSMTWIASLDHCDFDNDIARITANVITRFLDPTGFKESTV